MNKADNVIKQIRNYANVELKDLNPLVLAYRLGSINALCEDYFQTPMEKEEPVVDVSAFHPFELSADDYRNLWDSVSLTAKDAKKQTETVKETDPDLGVEKTFAEQCQEIIPEKPCTDDDTRLIELLERRGSHMNLKMEISHRWVNSGYAKTVYNLLAKYDIATMSDLMELLDDPEIRDLINYRDSRKKDEINKLKGKFPIFDLTSQDCQKIVAIYDTANDSKDKTAKDILVDFIDMPRSKVQANALVRDGICNVNQLYFWLSRHTLKDYTNLKRVGSVPDNVRWMYDYIVKTGKVVE